MGCRALRVARPRRDVTLDRFEQNGRRHRFDEIIRAHPSRLAFEVHVVVTGHHDRGRLRRRGHELQPVELAEPDVDEQDVGMETPA